jgi:hypothetical protein
MVAILWGRSMISLVTLQLLKLPQLSPGVKQQVLPLQVSAILRDERRVVCPKNK